MSTIDFQINKKQYTHIRGAYHLYHLERFLFLGKKVPPKYEILGRAKNFKKMCKYEIELFNKDFLFTFSLYSYLYFSSHENEKIKFEDEFYFASKKDFIEAKLFFHKNPLLYVKFVMFINSDSSIYEFQNGKIKIYNPKYETKKAIYALNHPNIIIGVLDKFTRINYRKNAGWIKS